MDWLQLTLMILTWGILGSAIVFVVAQLFGGRQMISAALGVFLLGFFARAAAILLNEEMVIFEPKLSGNLSLTLYQHYILDRGDWLGLASEQFGLQVIFNLPVWLVFGASRIALLMSNATAGALAAPLVCVLLFRDFKEKPSIRALLLLAIYPAGFNFSLFGLRDPLIFVAMLLLIVASVRLWVGGIRVSDIALLVVSTIGVMGLRPELAYVVLMVYLLPLMNGYVNLACNSLRQKRALSSLMILTLPILLVGCAAVLASTRVAAKNIGAQTFNPAELASTSAENRFERHESSLGGGSHIMSASLYRKLPWYGRVPVQTAGLVVLPFPWQINSASKMLAFLDSLFIMGIGFYAILNAFYAQPIRKGGLARFTLFLMLISFIGFLGIGFVVSNFGNGFRMKLAITPMIFLAGAVCPICVRVRFGAKRPKPQMAPAV